MPLHLRRRHDLMDSSPRLVAIDGQIRIALDANGLHGNQRPLIHSKAGRFTLRAFPGSFRREHVGPEWPGAALRWTSVVQIAGGLARHGSIQKGAVVSEGSLLFVE